MSVTVALAVGVDPCLLMADNPVMKSAGYVLISAGSVEEAIRHFKAGDFDIVLHGQLIPAEQREKLTFFDSFIGLPCTRRIYLQKFG